MMDKKYRFSVFSVASCPSNPSDWEHAAKRRNCSLSGGKNGYLCLPNQEKTSLLEFCYDEVRPMVQAGNCIELAGSGTVNQQSCRMFTDGCPTEPFLSGTIYTHPACLGINTKDRCYLKSPVCPNSSDILEQNFTPSAPENAMEIDWIPWFLVGILVLVLVGLLLMINRRKIRARFLRQWDRERSKDQEDIQIEEGSDDEKGHFLPKRATETSMDLLANTFHCQSTGDISFYTKFKAYDAVKEAIDRNKCVIIIGLPGCGKTALMNSVARCLSQTGYVIRIISSFNEISPPKCQESKTLYLFDDAFGIFNYNVLFTGVLDHYKNIDMLLKYKHSKLLMTCRTSVYKKVERFNFSAVVEVVDISDMSMNAEEKSILLENLSHSNMPADVDWMYSQSSHQCFPLLCVLYADFADLRKEKFDKLFRDPVGTFLHFLDYLQESRKLTYICLVWVVLHGRAQSPLIAQNDENSKELKTALMSCEKQEKENISVQNLITKFEHLIKEACWIQGNGNVCSFSHTFLFEMVAYHYGECHQKSLLEALQCNVIGEMFSVETTNDNERNHEFRIFVDNESLTERLLAGIQNKEYLDVFTNECWESQNFCDTFREVLQKKSDLNTLFWVETSETSCTYKCDIQSTKEPSLKNDDFEWYRQKLLEERTENIFIDGLYFDKKEKAISWVFGYGINGLLPYLVKDTNHIQSMTVSEKIRFLILAIFSKNVDCFDIALEFVKCEDLDKTCLLKTESEEDKTSLNKHKKFTPLTAACYRGFSEAIKKLVEKGSNINLKDENGNFPFLLACRFGNIADCLYLYEKKANINCSCGKGFTPLIAAVMNKNKKLVEFFIEKEVDVNKCTSDNKGPLYYAVKCSKDVEIVKLLTANKANVNEVATNGKSPLYWAAQNGSVEIAHFLIKQNAKINEVDENQKTPLYCASKRGHHGIVKLLLENGADVNIPTSQNRTALYRATKRGHLDIDKTLIKGNANVDKMDKKGYSPLYWASKRGYFYIVKLLLKNGASLNSKTDDGKTALHCAALAGHANIIQLLIDYKADVNSTDVKKRTALYLASKRGHLDVVKILIKHGSDINTATTKRNTALLRASKRNHIRVLKLLIDKKANVNHSNEKNQSPLYFAAKRGHLEIVEILLDAHADVNKACKYNQTALHWASLGGYCSIVKLLLERGANLTQRDNDNTYTCKSPLHYASKRGYLNIVRLLIEKEVDVNSVNGNDLTPLFYACKGNQKQVVEYLIEQNADVNLTNIFGETPLFTAAENGHIDIVKLLCNTSCNVNEYNNEHKTPMYFAAKNGHSEIVKYLLEAGAKSNITDKFGRLPITMAENNGHMDVVKILQQSMNP